VFTPTNCDDGNPCTIDSCIDKNGKCSNLQMSCPAQDACHKGSCSNGTCIQTAINCNDSIACTLDSCDAVKGCQNVPQNNVCETSDPCIVGTCSATIGCVNATFRCPPTGLKCTTDVCVSGHGCLNESKVCNSTQLQNCDTVACSEVNGTCVVTALACALAGPPSSVLVAATVSAGIIAAIVIAIIIFVSLSAGGSWAVYRRMNFGGVNTVTNNPLYRDGKTSGNNPLFRTNNV